MTQIEVTIVHYYSISYAVSFVTKLIHYISSGFISATLSISLSWLFLSIYSQDSLWIRSIPCSPASMTNVLIHYPIRTTCTSDFSLFQRNRFHVELQKDRRWMSLLDISTSSYHRQKFWVQDLMMESSSSCRKEKILLIHSFIFKYFCTIHFNDTYRFCTCHSK